MIALALLLPLAGLAPSAAAAAPDCPMTLRRYVDEYLAGAPIGWLGDGSAAEIVARGGVDAAAAPGVAREVESYVARLELPAEIKLGLAWMRRPWLDGPKLEVLGVDPGGCLVMSLPLEDYAPPRGGVDPPADEKAWTHFYHTRCGSALEHNSATVIPRHEPALEAGLIKDGQYSMSLSGGVEPGLSIAGRPIDGETFSFYPGERAPRLLIEGGDARFELPSYLDPSGERATPTRVVVQCRGDDRVDVLYVRADRTRRFSDIPVEIK